MFESLELMFESLELVFQSLEQGKRIKLFTF